MISSYGGIKDCTKDCQRTIPHSSYEKAPWMCKVKADNEDSDDYSWNLLDLGEHLPTFSHACIFWFRCSPSIIG